MQNGGNTSESKVLMCWSDQSPNPRHSIKESDENRVGNRFGSRGLVIKLNFCSDFQYKVEGKLKFGQYFAADVCLRLQS